MNLLLLVKLIEDNKIEVPIKIQLIRGVELYIETSYPAEGELCAIKIDATNKIEPSVSPIFD